MNELNDKYFHLIIEVIGEEMWIINGLIRDEKRGTGYGEGALLIA